MRFREFPINGRPYRIALWLVWIFVSLTLLLSLFSFAYDPSGSTHYYVSCNLPNDTSGMPFANMCHNFFYNNSNYCGSSIAWNDSLCSQEWIPNHSSIGHVPPIYVQDFWSIFLGLIALTLIINHLLYNRGFSIGDVS